MPDFAGLRIVRSSCVTGVWSVGMTEERRTMRSKQLLAMAILLAPLAAAACGGASDANASQIAQAPEAPAATSAPVTTTGTVIEVKMITDDKGNYFEPSTIDAKPGDVIRFVLVSGVHNVSLPAEQNPAGLTMPAPSDYLQLPGQTFDLTVTMPPGEYYFQCDPHAALGMTGHIRVGI
jgi:plastocyanin